MKKNIIILIVSLFIIQNNKAQQKQDIDEIFAKKFEYSMISKGDNFPDFSIKRDSVDFLLFSLHKSISIDSFKEKTNFDNDKISKITSFLISKNWLHTIEGQYKPTIFIASDKDGETLYKYATPISKDIVGVIKENLPKIKEQFSTTDISKSQTFEEWSFLILSDVLLDSWQIDNTEKDFLKQTERPYRHGKNYYQAIMENTDASKESFGIYGNQMRSKDGRTVAVYGNNRNTNVKPTFFYKISKHDDKIFSEMADSFLPELLFVLEKHRLYSENVYKELSYSDEITFEEFFIWWYHFIYTQATNEMANREILQIPENGNFYYEMLDD
ncbi:hypothetical protein CLV62_12082 [Dysgonomonas alginatilytica]|uniref:Uncharacterized protein n=1 Tax=Dysgonomonas alginatilytica TaxID=1605892 RepID=A0A2V3PNE2_9BACT|nr:hypothetical protein [Dysgonomonas alginatilytica]PXV62393.1 hypothetical protein CLV62_12082 [Dysgonomonas alginatilytica]